MSYYELEPRAPRLEGPPSSKKYNNKIIDTGGREGGGGEGANIRNKGPQIQLAHIYIHTYFTE